MVDIYIFKILSIVLYCIVDEQDVQPTQDMSSIAAHRWKTPRLKRPPSISKFSHRNIDGRSRDVLTQDQNLVGYENVVDDVSRNPYVEFAGELWDHFCLNGHFESLD